MQVAVSHLGHLAVNDACRGGGGRGKRVGMVLSVTLGI